MEEIIIQMGYIIVACAVLVGVNAILDLKAKLTAKGGNPTDVDALVSTVTRALEDGRITPDEWKSILTLIGKVVKTESK